jgi:hypothetical protein
MKNFIDKIFKKLSSLPTPVVVILKLISIPVVFVLAIVVIFKAFHLYHAIDSYFTKKSYSRDVKVVFEYNGDEYVINTKVKCLNKGVTINEGSMEWYTSWDMDYEYKNNNAVLGNEFYASVYFPFILCDEYLKRDRKIIPLKDYVQMPNKIDEVVKIRVNKKNNTSSSKNSENLYDSKVISIDFGQKEILPTNFFNQN